MEGSWESQELGTSVGSSEGPAMAADGNMDGTWIDGLLVGEEDGHGEEAGVEGGDEEGEPEG